MREVVVDLGDRSYPVLVGSGARHRLGEVVPFGTSRVAVVTQDGIPWEVDSGFEQRVFTLDGGEEAKNLESVEQLCREFARWDMHRGDAVVALGGGVVTDVAGFAASVYHRGVPVVHVPTTLLGQIDAAIGGKTGVNLPEGKNLVGAFWQPSAVLCDTETLSTLPPREYRSGLGEMVKYEFLGLRGLRDLPLDEAVAACVDCKAAVVAGDERESGGRAVLNYGHTLAHALETAGSYDLRHGEAVAIGLVFAARLAHRLGRIDDERARRAPTGGCLVRPAARPAPRFGSGSAGGHHATRQEGRTRGAHLRPGRSPWSRAGAGGRRVGGARNPRRARKRRAGQLSLHLVVLLSGPNLNLLGQREPHIYGTSTLEDHVATARKAAAGLGLEVEHHQADSEAGLVALVHGARNRASAIIVNPGAVGHYGWSLHDALASFEGPVIELHLSNPDAREPWRRTSVVAPVSTGCISGFGGDGYRLAVEAVAGLLSGR